MNTANQKKPTFKLDDFNGLSREHLARVCDVMDMATYFEDMLMGEASMELCEKGDTKKAFKQLAKSYKNLKKFMGSPS